MGFPYRLDRRIKILTAPTGTSAIGEPTTAGTEVCSAWAAWFPVRGQEVAASRDAAVATDAFVIRYRTDLDETMQVEFGGDTYQIHRIAPPKQCGRNEGLELTCERIR
jgi:SPP1 family predicted phage head-tail adaptor